MQNKTISMDAAHDFYAKMPLARAIPLGLQHVFAMFVGNLTPLLIIMGANMSILAQAPQAIQLIFGGSGIVPAAMVAILLNIVLPNDKK